MAGFRVVVAVATRAIDGARRVVVGAAARGAITAAEGSTAGMAGIVDGALRWCVLLRARASRRSDGGGGNSVTPKLGKMAWTRINNIVRTRLVAALPAAAEEMMMLASDWVNARVACARGSVNRIASLNSLHDSLSISTRRP